MSFADTPDSAAPPVVKVVKEVVEVEKIVEVEKEVVVEKLVDRIVETPWLDAINRTRLVALLEKLGLSRTMVQKSLKTAEKKGLIKPEK